MRKARYFSSREISIVALFSGIWALLNFVISPFVWQITHLPFTCDLIGFVSLIIAIHLTRRPGMGSAIGLVSTLLTLFLKPDALYFFGFTMASIAFDIISMAIGYETFFDRKGVSFVMIIIVSVGSAGLAGLIIGRFFMTFTSFELILTFAALHAIGGLIAAVLGYLILVALRRKGV